ncbi:MAG: NAD(P)H-quinone oxidoreductase [Betaproteobacteria bacterium]|nr:NAD(P)H-quinone oxidoreductase [Betaproteobacteria bacterium]
MKAIRVHERGGPETLVYEEAPDPVPGPGEVLLRVRAVGVNFADSLMRIGAYPAEPPPFIPGLEAAGTVDALGSGVTDLATGEAVMGWVRRSYAELAVAPRSALMPMPGGLDFSQAAAIPVVFATAWHALVTLASVQAGERVLIHAAGSGVGTAAIQIAKRLGAWVLCTAGQDWKLDRSRELGADAGINYSDQDLPSEIARVTGGEGIHVVLEGVGRTTFAASMGCLVPGGRLVIYGSPSGPRVELDTRLAIFRNLTLYGMSISTHPKFPETARDFAERALPWFATGAVRPVVDAVFPLPEAAAAHQRLMDRAQFGKIVLDVA